MTSSHKRRIQKDRDENSLSFFVLRGFEGVSSAAIESYFAHGSCATTVSSR